MQDHLTDDEKDDEYSKMVTVEMPVRAWNAVLADLNLYRLHASEASSKFAKRLAAEISRQMDGQTELDCSQFAGTDVYEIEKPVELEDFND